MYLFNLLFMNLGNKCKVTFYDYDYDNNCTGVKHFDILEFNWLYYCFNYEVEKVFYDRVYNVTYITCRSRFRR